jgi:hypothetical protein
MCTAGPCPVASTAAGSRRSAAKRTAACTSAAQVAQTSTEGRCRTIRLNPAASCE